MNALTKKVKNKKGFTLIELIVVIVIIGILAAIAIPRLAGFTKSADDKAAIADARTIITAMATHYAEDPKNNIGSITEAKIKELSGPYKGTLSSPKIEAGGKISFTYKVGDSKLITVTNGEISGS